MLLWFFSHLFSPVAVLLQQMPLERHVRRPGLTLQEGGAALHAVLNRLQSVLIGWRNNRRIILWYVVTITGRTKYTQAGSEEMQYRLFFGASEMKAKQSD